MDKNLAVVVAVVRCRKGWRVLPGLLSEKPFLDFESAMRAAEGLMTIERCSGRSVDFLVHGEFGELERDPARSFRSIPEAPGGARLLSRDRVGAGASPRALFAPMEIGAAL